jgi:hypothetical protein
MAKKTAYPPIKVQLAVALINTVNRLMDSYIGKK